MGRSYSQATIKRMESLQARGLACSWGCACTRPATHRANLLVDDSNGGHINSMRFCSKHWARVSGGGKNFKIVKFAEI